MLKIYPAIQLIFTQLTIKGPLDEVASVLVPGTIFLYNLCSCAKGTLIIVVFKTDGVEGINMIACLQANIIFHKTDFGIGGIAGLFSFNIVAITLAVEPFSSPVESF